MNPGVGSRQTWCTVSHWILEIGWFIHILIVSGGELCTGLLNSETIHNWFPKVANWRTDANLEKGQCWQSRQHSEMLTDVECGKQGCSLRVKLTAEMSVQERSLARLSIHHRDLCAVSMIEDWHVLWFSKWNLNWFDCVLFRELFYKHVGDIYK